MTRHRHYRQDVVDYMTRNRADFEPFVEDERSFADHIRNLEKEGTFAGNDALVAFSRLHRINVVIHQLNAPCLQVNGALDDLAPCVHLSYHNGDHYSSVRHIGDAGKGPGMMQGRRTVAPGRKGKQRSAEKKDTSTASSDPFTEVKQATGCQDDAMIQQTLEDTNFDVDATIGTLLQIMDLASEAVEDSQEVSMPKERPPRKGDGKPANKKEEKHKPHLSNRKRKEQAKAERKERRLEERKGQKRAENETSTFQIDSSFSTVNI